MTEMMFTPPPQIPNSHAVVKQIADQQHQHQVELLTALHAIAGELRAQTELLQKLVPDAAEKG